MSLIRPASRTDLVLTQKPLATQLRAVLPRHGAVTTRVFDRVVSAVDASHYLLTPDAVLVPNSIAEIADILAFATRTSRPVTFRSGGT